MNHPQCSSQTAPDAAAEPGPADVMQAVIGALPVPALAEDGSRVIALNVAAAALLGIGPVAAEASFPRVLTSGHLHTLVLEPERWHGFVAGVAAPGEERSTALELLDGRAFIVHVRTLALAGDTRVRLWCWTSGPGLSPIAGRADPASERDRLRLYLDMAEVILVVLDRKGCVRMANRAAARILGMPEDELIGREWFELALTPDWHEPLRDIFGQAMSGLAPEQSSFEHPIRTPAGERLVAWRSRTLFDDQGMPCGVVNSGDDITEQRAMEYALRASEHTFASVFHTSPDPIVICQVDDGVCIDVNPAFEELTGYGPDEAIGDTVLARLGIPGTREGDDDFRARLHQVGTVRNIECRYRTREGRESHALASAGLVELQGRECMLVMLKDISDRIAAETALRASEQRFRSYFDQDLIAIAMFRIDGGWTDVNPAFRGLLGYDRSELMSIPWPELTPAEDLAREAVLLQQVRQRSLDRYVIEKHLRHRNGALIPVMTSVGAVRNADGELQYLIAIVQDISAQKRQADQLLQAQKMEAVGQLTGGIAHDFNNLLTIIMGNLELLQLALPADSEDQILVEDALSAATDGRELTRQMLIFSRGKSLEARAVDVGGLVHSIDRLLRRALPQNVELVKGRGVDAGVRALVDAHQFQSVLVNLMLNAGDAMPQGGEVRIDIASADPATVAQLNLEPGDYIQVDVHDQGVGMTGEVLSRACEPFFTTKEVGRGTGLGLSMAYTFLKKSGGHLWLESEPGRGTGVHMVLPAAGGRHEELRPPPERQSVPGGTEHILVVEDESRVRQLAMRHLRDLGYRVQSASTGAEAVEMLERDGSFDLLFSDVVMPGSINGYELADIVRAGRPRLKVLLTTGFDRGAGTSIAAGALHWPVLPKPYTKKHLACMIRQLLDEGPRDDTTGVTK